MAQSATIILGISAYYHDSAAALLVDGRLVAAAQEERFSRVKHDPGFPASAISYVLSEAGVNMSDVTVVAFYDKPYIKFERLLETYHVFAPAGLRSFLTAIPVWIKEKLFLKKVIRDELTKIQKNQVPLAFPEHHLSHAASAYYPSPFDEAAILTIDGVGEWATTSLGKGTGNTISVLKEIHFPHSLGLLYSAFTFYCGFKVNSGEYKLMGLAPYGDSSSSQCKEFVKKIKSHLIDYRDDGSYVLNLEYFQFPTGMTMTNDRLWNELFCLPRLKAETELTQPYMNLALAIQLVTEDIVIRLARTSCELANSSNLVMAGGVALNCVANGKLLKETFIDNLWIQPAAGDAGGAVGAAFAVWHISMSKPRQVIPGSDAMSYGYLGPACSDQQVNALRWKYGAVSQSLVNLSELCAQVSRFLDDGLVVGWFQGRMEFGPRALCNRSILGDPRKVDMQKKINMSIKYREGFRPFAPVVQESKIQDYFDLSVSSPYMLLVAPVRDNIRKDLPGDYMEQELYERLYVERSSLPAITHVDYSARIQSVTRESNEKMYELLDAFQEATGSGVLINTSFNVRGEPIVCTPEDAYRCFMETEMEVLVIGHEVFIKADQPEWTAKHSSFQLD